MILRKKTWQKIGAVLLSFATVFGLVTMPPATVHADGEEPEPHEIRIQIDGFDENYPIKANVQYSYDGATWYNPFSDTLDAFDTLDNSWIGFVLEDNQAAWDAIDETANLVVKVHFDVAPNGYGNTKSIKAAQRNWETDILHANNPNLQPGDDYYDDLFLEFSIEDIKTEENRGLHGYCVAFAYDQEGDPAIVAEVSNNLFATYDLSEDGRKSTLAMVLYKNYVAVPMFGEWELPVVDINRDPEDAGLAADFEAASMELRARIEDATDGGTITVRDAAGNTSTRAVKNYRVHWGNDSDGMPVESVVPVICLTDPEEFIVCTDFNSTTGRGTTYYTRTRADEVLFNEDGSAGSGCVIYADSFTTVRAGGHMTNTASSEAEDYYAVAVATDWAFTQFVPGGHSYNSVTRILDPSSTYVALIGDGEPNEFGNLGENGYAMDVIWKAGENSVANTYIGYSSVYIEPLILSGLTTKEIVDVTLADPTQKDGVVIDKTDLTKVKVTFKSNYYDSVPLNITYAGGLKRELTINRIGLVISYQYLDGALDHSEVRHEKLHLDYNQDDLDFSYDYFAGEQILIWATYYHPTNDLTAEGGDDLYLNMKFDNGTNRIISHVDSAHGFNGYSPAGRGTVASTSFIIGFAQATEWDGNRWVGNVNDPVFAEGGFSATVINAGYDDDDTYGGTQIGSGNGVYWSGHMNWFNH